MTRRRKITLGIAGTVVVLLGALTLRLFRYPPTDQPGPVDAVVMLAGGGLRVDKAVELGVDLGLADTVVFASAWVPDQGVWSASPCNSSGQPRMADTTAICFQPDPPSTRGEVREIARMARENGWTSIIVVASTDQITRARMLLNRCWEGEASFIGVSHDQPFVFRAVYEWGAIAKALIVDRSC